MKKIINLCVLFGIMSAILVGCSDNDNEKEVQASEYKLAGAIEKGPFEEKSTLEVMSLKDDLSESTPQVVSIDSKSEYTASLKSTTPSKYLKLTAKGKYFDEITGGTSEKDIELNAIVEASDQQVINVNVNVLTHLESGRIKKLLKEGKTFAEAKKTASKEVLKAFMIEGVELNSNLVSLTDNNQDANILAAISAIALNNAVGDEASKPNMSVQSLLDEMRDDIAKNGGISELMKQEIAHRSFNLPYENVTNNLKSRYAEMDKKVKLDQIQKYIDGEAKGEIGYEWSPELPVTINPEDGWTNELSFRNAYMSSLKMLSQFIEHYSMSESAYAMVISKEDATKNGLMNFYEHKLDAYDYRVFNVFSLHYQAVHMYNRMIEVYKEKDVEAGKKYALSAQLLRAHAYLMNIQMWGDAVLVLKPVLIGSKDMYPSRTPEKDVLDFIINDIEAIYSQLPSEEGVIIGRDFADALLAKAYLRRGEYDKALEKTKRLIDGNTGVLLPNRGDNFALENTKESYLNLLKNDNSSTENSEATTASFISVIRYAEVLLIDAESNMQLGNITEALTSLNKVRQRNKKEILANSISKEELKLKIVEEYKTDLGLEGLVFATMKRLGLAEKMLNIKPYQLLYPIPMREMDNNKNMTQNPGYKKTKR